MASIHRNIIIDAPASVVWDAIRDVGAAHKRVFPGVLTDVYFDGDGVRVATFANGLVVRECIIDIDDDRRRLSYASVGGRLTHHNASLQVFPDGDLRSCVVWTTDLLPDDLVHLIESLVDQGARAMKSAFMLTSKIGG
jgi:Polyketide cyclase / dehydrase and lipid transport